MSLYRKEKRPADAQLSMTFVPELRLIVLSSIHIVPSLVV